MSYYNVRFVEYFRWFKPGWCNHCGKFTFFILKSKGSHESCWLVEK